MKNSVYAEVVGDTAGGHLVHLNNVEWIRGGKLRMQMFRARMSLDSIVQYVSVGLKLDSKNKAQIKDRHGHGNRGCQEDQNYAEIPDELTVGEDQSQSPGSEDRKAWSGGEYMTWTEHEDAHFFASVAHHTKVYGHDKAKWKKRTAPENWKSPVDLSQVPAGT